MNNRIFVYGTLMEGMSNHAFLKDCKKLGMAEIEGYEMYLLGHYPGIIKREGSIIGEVYEVTDETLAQIDMLEDEGNLYSKELVKTQYGEAYVYVYKHSVDGKPKIPYEMQPYNKLVYYVSYGSNMLEERFLNYIQGGICKFNKKQYEPCTNSCKPVKSVSVTLPYDMYFANYSGSWNGAVSFLNDTKPGFSYGRAYLITESQYKEVKEKEGNSDNWYGKEVILDSIDNFTTKTFTQKNKHEHKSLESVTDDYIKVLTFGLQEAHNLSDDEIKEYLKRCGEQ